MYLSNRRISIAVACSGHVDPTKNEIFFFKIDIKNSPH